MDEKVYVDFLNESTGKTVELEVPLDITANNLVLALNSAYELGMDTENVYTCYLVMENPIAFLRGNKTIREFGVRNGSVIIFSRNGK